MDKPKANLEVFASTLLELAHQDSNLLVVTSDSRGSGKLAPFGKAVPGQIVEVGIAEQNLVGVAAGLAAAGKTVFAVSPACFVTARSLEQIKNDICYSDRPVKVVGISAGVSYGALGSTHHSLHDFAALRAIHNVTIIAPADNFETREAVLAAAKTEVPVYLRFGKKAMPDLARPSKEFELGKGLAHTRGHRAYLRGLWRNRGASFRCGATAGQRGRGMPSAEYAHHQTPRRSRGAQRGQ